MLTRRTLLAAPTLVLPASAIAAPENPWTKAQRLGRELSDHLDSMSENGTLMMKLYPGGSLYPRVNFCEVDKTPEQMLQTALHDYKAAARLIEPESQMVWLHSRPDDDRSPCRFLLAGKRI